MRPQPDPVRPGQESVWDFPRPAIAQPVAVYLRIVHRGEIVAETRDAVRVIETSHPPTYYLPRADVRAELRPVPGRRSLCEWKGAAVYFDVLAGGDTLPAAAFAYPAPTPAFASIAGHVAFYAASFDSCFVDGERVTPQPGGFYAGWITSRFAGPFKGGPGSHSW